MADDYTDGFDKKITVGDAEEFSGNYEGKDVASAAVEMGGIEEELLVDGGVRTQEGFILGSDGSMAYVSDPDFLKIDRMVKYVASILKDGLTQAFWADNVVPPLRTAFRDIFTKQGPKDWRPNTKNTAIFKHAFDLKGARVITGGKVRPQHFTGAYRSSLVVTKGLWNRKGNLFVPLQDSDNVARRFAEIYAEAGVDSGNRWSKGFTWGVDLPYFSEHARKFWEGVKSQVNIKSNITPKQIEGSSRRVRILKWLYRQDITTQQEFNDFISDQQAYSVNYPYFMETGVSKRFLSGDKTYDIKARPVFGYFKTDNPITKNFYRKVEKNMLGFMRKYLEKGARDEWYGGPGRISKSDSPLQRFKQPFIPGATEGVGGRMTADRDITRDDLRVSQVEQEAFESEALDAETLFSKHAAGDILSSEEYISVIRHSVDLAESGGLTFTQRQMAEQLNIPVDDIEFDDE